MRPYRAYISTTLRLTSRDRLVLFFNYLMPLIFFVAFGEGFGARQSGGALTQVFSMVLIIGVLGNGFFGGGMRAVLERETGILRRFKVAPITPAPILVASIFTGWLLFMPAVFLFLAIGAGRYRMPIPPNLISLLAFISIGMMAFRSVGLIIASVVNSMAESQIIIQLLYLPMLMLSGATIPLNIMPEWLQTIAQFLPSTHLYLGMQGILVRGESILANWQSAAALAITTAAGLLLSVKLFRWEKEEKLKPSAKFWVLAVLAPFVITGAWQIHSKDNLRKTKMLTRQMRRDTSWLIKDARVFVGDGRVLESANVLVRNGRIEKLIEGRIDDVKPYRAEVLEASGKTVMPGLIDAHVHLGSPGGVLKSASDYDADRLFDRELSAYLYSGVTGVRSAGDSLEAGLAARAGIASGERQGAELFLCGPMFTAPGGHGTEYFDRVPEPYRKQVLAQVVRTPSTPAEAAAQVAALKAAGVDAIKAILEAGVPGRAFPRLDTSLLAAIGKAAHEAGLPLAVHTASDRDILDALAAGAASIEHGTFAEPIPASTLARMKESGAALVPTLAVVEAFEALTAGRLDPLSRSLVQQVAPPGLLDATRAALAGSGARQITDSFKNWKFSSARAMEMTKSAFDAGVPLVTGSDSGNFLLVHGPAIHRELQLWVKAGIPPAEALKAATSGAARLLGAGNRIGLIQPGYDATLVVVEGNPLEDISVTERIWAVLFKGERVARGDLFDDDEKESKKP
jgi:imidazolonepropionase-like amidohydrolase/ABC-type multidrug transport system permease subunit